MVEMFCIDCDLGHRANLALDETVASWQDSILHWSEGPREFVVGALKSWCANCPPPIEDCAAHAIAAKPLACILVGCARIVFRPDCRKIEQLHAKNMVRGSPSRSVALRIADQTRF
jgi:hypothetical protein